MTFQARGAGRDLEADTRDLGFPFKKPDTPPGPRGILELGTAVSSSSACWGSGKFCHVPKLRVSLKEKPSCPHCPHFYPQYQPSSAGQATKKKIGMPGEKGSVQTAALIAVPGAEDGIRRVRAWTQSDLRQQQRGKSTAHVTTAQVTTREKG